MNTFYYNKEFGNESSTTLQRAIDRQARNNNVSAYQQSLVIGKLLDDFLNDIDSSI